MKRVSIYIDGSNFYHLVLKKLGVQETDFNYEKFADFLADGRALENISKRFYVGTVRERDGDEYSKKAMARQTKLFNILKSNNWEIKTSKLRFRIEKIKIDNRTLEYKKLKKLGAPETIHVQRYREKGIDVKIATDLIVGAIDDKYDIAIVVSSDGDLIPAIDWVRHRTNKKIEYIGFSILDDENPENSSKPLSSMITHTDIQRVLVETDIKRFVKSSLFNAKD